MGEVSGFGRQLSLLSEGDKFQKTKALHSTKEEILHNSLTHSHVDELLRLSVVLLADPAERVREQCLDILQTLADRDNSTTDSLLRVYIPFLSKRLGQPEVKFSLSFAKCFYILSR